MGIKRALFIGGTGTISTAITMSLSSNPEWELYVLNRGNRADILPENVKQIIVSDVNNEEELISALGDLNFDTVCDFIGFVPSQLERDFRVFRGRTKQFMYISSASAYEKPCSNYIINEETPLVNPYWEYSRNKIACENFLFEMYEKHGFPVTIIRPSHTFSERSVPLGVHGSRGSYQVIKRMKEGKPVIIHGDGTSLWTMTLNRDFAKRFIPLMGNERAIGEAFQITNGESLTWNQIYQYIADALGVELKAYHVASEFLAAVSDYDFTGGLIGDKANTVVFSDEKLVKLGIGRFTDDVPFKDSIKEVVDYVLSHPDCQVEDPEFDAWCDKVIEGLEAAKELISNYA